VDVRPTVDFGTPSSGTTETLTVNVVNEGTNTATSVSVGLANGSDYSISNDTCIASVAGGSSCSFDVDFNTISNGTYIDAVIISYQDGLDNRFTRTPIQGSRP